MCPLKLQTLPPRLAHFCLGIERFVRKDLNLDLQGASVLVAFSGGADSTALLLVACLLAPRLGLRVSAAHLDHGLRKEAAAEAEAAQKLCAALGVDCHTERAAVAELAENSGVGLEEAGRTLRYAFLERVREQLGADYILLGHHLNDLAEDLFMRLIRGTGWPGLAGMPAVDEKRRLLRPLLLTPKDALEDLADSLRIPWQTDQSNTDPQFLRNRVRGRILPLFLQENPRFLQSVADLWRLGRLDREAFEKAGAALWQKDPALAPQGAGFLSKTILDNASEALRLRLYKHELDVLGPGQALCAGLWRLDAAWQARRTGKSFQFPGDKLARIERDGIRFVYSG